MDFHGPLLNYTNIAPDTETFQFFILSYNILNLTATTLSQSLSPPLTPLQSQDKQARVEDVDEDEDLEAGSIPKDPFMKDYPRPAGSKLRNSKNLFEKIHTSQCEKGLNKNPWALFENEDKWYLAHFLLMSGIS